MLDVRVEKLKLHRSVKLAIRKHAKREADKGNYEAIGFLAQTPGESRVHVRLELHNHAPNPQHAYFVEPWEQFRAERKLAEGGYEIVGTYHSHVNSEALPSQSDHKLARPGEVVIIYSVVFDDMRAYREQDGNLLPIDLEVVRG